MTDRTLQAFITARGKTGVILVDYQMITGDVFAIWDIAKLGPVPTVAEVLAMERTDAQATILTWPIETKALVLTLLDQINVIRAALPVPLGPITPAQALAAVSTKAGQIS